MAKPQNRYGVSSAAVVDPPGEQPEGLLEQLDHLLRDALAGTTDVSSPTTIAIATDVLSHLRQAVAQREQTIAHMRERSEAMVRAQADALVHSAEIIDELERTKQSLCEARQAAERAAEETQRLADTVFERTNDGVLVFANQTCVACNDNALELLGASRDTIIGDWPQALVQARHPDGTVAGDDIRRRYHSARLANPILFEVQLPTALGCWFWAEITFSAFCMNDTGHILAVVRDINARKEFEVELQRHRDFLNNIINAVPDQLAVTTSDRSLVLANDAYCAAHNVTLEELVGSEPFDSLPPELRKNVEQIERELLLTGVCQTLEQPLIRPDGSQAVLSVKRSVFAGVQGDRYIVSASRDITEDRQREDRLRLLASVFNGASEGVAIIAADGSICEANPAFMTMVGDHSPQVIGHPLHRVIRFEQSNVEEVFKSVASGSTWTGKANLQRSGARARHFWVSLSPTADSQQLTPRVIALVSDITELEDAQAQLISQALYDNLTGLPNRRCFRERLQALIEDNHPPEHGVTVCFLDLDDFKHVNDSTGHAAGDSLLEAVGIRIKSTMGPDAFVARFGGDEFAMILTAPQHQPPHLNAVLELLLNEFRRPFDLGDSEAIVGLSIGVTHWPDQAQDVGSLMCNADIAMYAAKSAGKNRIGHFSPEMEDSVNTRHQVQTKLRRALKGGQIALCYQPKVCAQTGRTVSCEALARWKTPDGTIVSPAEFVPIAEQTGLILPLGELVFRQAAQQAALWEQLGQRPTIAINVSPNQLRHMGFVSQLQTVIDELKVKPEWFELEITEYAMMEDVEHAMSVVKRLADMGFSIAIDDFGTGYSSLSYLKHFRIHTLKIDMSFVRDVTYDPRSAAVVRSITSLGQGLGLKVVAEGVETAEQAKLLAEIGCTVLQGFYIGHPMLPDQFTAWQVQRDGQLRHTE
jgi:diguanylate cyclase (GGDEF)-like protein/PAS domain S-box-containing protein